MSDLGHDAVSAYVASTLARLGVFRFREASSVAELAQFCSLMSLPGGNLLMEEREPSDCVYIIVSGILAVYRQDAHGQQSLINLIGAGEIVGEMGILTGEPRMATVKALRNAELIAISKSDLDSIAARNSSVVLAFCETIVRRLRNSYEFAPGPFRPRTLCLIPHDPNIDMAAAAEAVAAVLQSCGSLLVVTEDGARQHDATWFSDQEKKHGFLLYLADCQPTAWTRFCLRQSDCALIMAPGPATPTEIKALDRNRGDRSAHIPIDLVLLWPDRIAPEKTKLWLELVKPRAHHHVRSKADFARATRLATGRGVGVVLSGGGARGLAHVGVVHALKEHNIPIDVIGGTSIGAIVAASVALEWDVKAVAKAWADAFARQRITDFTIPRVSLFSHRKLHRTLGQWFGSLRIEDAPIRFFCVSCNLIAGVEAIHRSGPFSTWLQASVAIPGVFPPVVAGGAVHVDGGVLNNLPTDIVRDFGVSTVIAVDVGTDFAGAAPSSTSAAVDSARCPNMLDLLWRVGTINSTAKIESARRGCSILLRPDLGGIGRLNWRLCEQAIEAGYRAAEANIDAIKAALDAPGG